MNKDTVWYSIDTDMRNVLLEGIRRRSAAMLVAVFLAFFFVLGVLPAAYLAGAAASVQYIVLYRRTTRQLLAAGSRA